MYAKNTLGEVAQMQEAGVPVTFAYISDAHDFHGVSGNTHTAYGPGEAGYVQQLKDYDTAFGQFFTRLANDGITKATRSSCSPSRRATISRAPRRTPPCDGVTTPCTYANGHVTEVNGDLKRMVADLQPRATARTPRPTSASTPTWRRTSTSTRQPGARLGPRA